MSFYKYFPSKNDLIKEYLEKDCKVLEYRLRAELQKKNICTEKALAIFSYFAELSSMEGYRGSAFINVFIETSMDLEFIKDQSLKFNSTLIKLFYEQLNYDFSKDVSTKMAEQFTQLLIGAIIQAQMKNSCDPVLFAQSTAKELIEKNYAENCYCS
jgi:AcrR family transcriptional regulator